MKISSREKRLLIIVLSIAVGVLYYSYPFKSNKIELKNKVNEKEQIINQYKKELKEIDDIEKRKVKLVELKETAVKKAEKYYPEIIQEKLMKEVETLMSKNSLTADYSWAEKNSNVVENLTPPILNLPHSSTQGLADIIKSSLDDKADKMEANSEESVATSEITESKTASPVQMVLAVNFKGSYDSLRSFIQDVKEYDRVVTISALTTKWESGTEISGTMNIEFYSIPKINDDDNLYLEWH